jgi:hypothetical protein
LACQGGVPPSRFGLLPLGPPDGVRAAREGWSGSGPELWRTSSSSSQPTHNRQRRLLQVGVCGQISLVKEFAGRTVVVESSEPWIWVIKTAQTIPGREFWLQQPQAMARCGSGHGRDTYPSPQISRPWSSIWAEFQANLLAKVVKKRETSDGIQIGHVSRRLAMRVRSKATTTLQSWLGFCPRLTCGSQSRSSPPGAAHPPGDLYQASAACAAPAKGKPDEEYPRARVNGG